MSKEQKKESNNWKVSLLILCLSCNAKIFGIGCYLLGEKSLLLTRFLTMDWSGEKLVLEAKWSIVLALCSVCLWSASLQWSMHIILPQYITLLLLHSTSRSETLIWFLWFNLASASITKHDCLLDVSCIPGDIGHWFFILFCWS